MAEDTKKESTTTSSTDASLASFSETTTTTTTTDPVFDEGQPIFDEGEPVFDEGAPVFDEGAPVFDEGAPVFDEGAPVFDEGAPVFDEGEPVFDEGTPDETAEEPTLEVSDSSGTEDQAIVLNIAASLTDLDGSETLTVTIAGVPQGATLSAGTDNGDGTWTLTEEDLEGLTITPPEDDDTDFTLTVSATSYESSTGDTTTVTGTLDVVVEADADEPTLVMDSTSTSSGDEEIALNISSTLNDTDGSESLTTTISNVPEGSTLSAGTDNGDGTWTLEAEDLDGLTMTQPSDGTTDFSLEVTATSTEADGGDIAAVTGTVDVSLADGADTPTLVLSDSAGIEDQSIALNISAGLTDLDGSETLSVTVSGVPAGADLSAGIDNGDGTWTLTGADLTGLTVTPPADSDADFTLAVTATATETSGETASVSGSLNVSVAADADAPTLVVNDAAGTEDQAIALNLSAGLTDLDGSESLSVTISGVPDGATLSAGTDNQDGTWTLSQADLGGLTLTPPADSDADFTLSVSATATESTGDTATVSGSLNVSVAADADAPTLVVNDAAGTEDQTIALNLSAGLTDLDGSESLSVTISGVPDGATLSAGTDNQDGTWTLNQADLSGLTLTPPADSDADFSLSVSATATESTGDTATVSGSLNVSVAADADAPTLVVGDVAGDEDQAIALNIAAGLTDLDGSESLSVTVSGVPAGATLSAGTDNGDGTWTLTEGDLTGLTVTPPENSDVDFTLGVSATATESGGDTATVTGTMNVSVAAVADVPILQVSDVTGIEDTAVSLDIYAALTDLDGSETLSVTVTDVPAGAILSAGTDNGDGTWTLATADLEGLTITPPANSDSDFTLGVKATSTEGDGGDTATATVNVSLSGDADAPTLIAADAAGTEDQAIALDISASLTDLDGSESLSVTIAGVPAGATLSAGTDNGDGSWTLTEGDLAGLTLNPPADSDADFALIVKATATELNGDSNTVTGSMNVSVAADADAPTLVVNDAAGTEDQAIALNLSAGLTDLDGSESLSVTISGVPDGATLSAGTDNQDGTWTLSQADLGGLTLTPPADSDADFTLSVSATATESTGDTATVSGSLNVSVAADADAPTLVVNDAAGTEDQAVALNIAAGLTDLDGSESLSVTVSGVPDGASLSAGIDNGDGSWTLSAAELTGLTLNPPADSDVDFALTVQAIATEAAGDVQTVTGTINVSLAADADLPTLVVNDAAGTEDQAIPLDIQLALNDVDGSESLAGDIILTGVPEGASLNLGSAGEGGTWLISPADLAVTESNAAGDAVAWNIPGLTITPPYNSDADFELGVRVTIQDGADTISNEGSLMVAVAPQADGAIIESSEASGLEDTAIDLNINMMLRDQDGSESLLGDIILTNVPEGATLNVGQPGEEGTWVLAQSDLSVTAINADGDAIAWTIPDLTITPPEDSGDDFELGVRMTVQDGVNTVTSENHVVVVVSEGQVSVDVIPEVDDVIVKTTDSAGLEDQPIALDIGLGLQDLDGSESLSGGLILSGVPEGAALNLGAAGEEAGTWVIPQSDLTVTAQNDAGDAVAWQATGLTITPPADSDVDFNLTMTATVIDGDDVRTVVSDPIHVDVTGVADAPTLLGADTEGDEDTAIALDFSAELVDRDGSESLGSVTLSGIPEGSVLSAGVLDEATGLWSVDPADLAGLTVTPPPNYSGELTVRASVSSTENDGDVATTLSDSVTVVVHEVPDAPELDVDPDSFQVEGSDGVLHLEVAVAGHYFGRRDRDDDDHDHDDDSRGGRRRDRDEDDNEQDRWSFAGRGRDRDDDSRGGRDRDEDDEEHDRWSFAGRDRGRDRDDDSRGGSRQGRDRDDDSRGGSRQGRDRDDDSRGGSRHGRDRDDDSRGGSRHGRDDDDHDHNHTSTFQVHVDGELVGTFSTNVNHHATGGWDHIAIGGLGLEEGAGHDITITSEHGGRNAILVNNITYNETVLEAESEGVPGSSRRWHRHDDDEGHHHGIRDVEVLDDSVKLGRHGELSFEISNAIAVEVAPALELTDVDSDVMTGAVIRIADGMMAGDSLDLGSLNIVVDAAGRSVVEATGIEVVGGGFDAESGQLTLAGTASMEAYNEVLAAIQLNNHSPGERQIDFTVTDHTGVSSDLQSIHLDVLSGADGEAVNGNLVVGSEGRDHLRGTRMEDDIRGRGGDDHIHASRGNDVVDGGDGNDRIDGGRGDDVLNGGAGNDRIDGDRGNDVIEGGAGNDRIGGDRGDDVIDGGAGNDRIDGDRGNDILTGGAGDDRMRGDRGQDILDGGEGDDRMDGGRGNDTMSGGAGADRMDGDRGNDKLDGGAGNDQLSGGRGEDVLTGGAGDDLLRGGRGDDQLQGGSGNDKLYGDEGDDVFTFGANGGYDFVKGGRGWTDGVRLEDVKGGPVDEIRGEGDWTLNTDANYTTDGNTLVFGDEDAAGVITLWDGTQVEFEEILTIVW